MVLTVREVFEVKERWLTRSDLPTEPALAVRLRYFATSLHLLLSLTCIRSRILGVFVSGAFFSREASVDRRSARGQLSSRCSRGVLF